MIPEYESRIALRLSKAERQQIERLVREGRFESYSQVVRIALQEFLSREESQHG